MVSDYVHFSDLEPELTPPESEVIQNETSKIQNVRSWIGSYLTPFSKQENDKTEEQITDYIRKSQTESIQDKSRLDGNVDVENRTYWMSDSAVKNCHNCDKEFSLTRRRHHCRYCGQIFCWKCAPLRPNIGMRSCQKCLDLRRKSVTTSSPNMNRVQSNFTPFLSDISIPVIIDINYKEILDEFIISLDFKSTTSLLNTIRPTKTLDRTFSGRDLVSFLKEKNLKPDLCQVMVDEKIISNTNSGEQNIFIENENYRIVEIKEDEYHHIEHPVIETNENAQDLLECALQDESSQTQPVEQWRIPDQCLNCVDPLFGTDFLKPFHHYRSLQHDENDESIKMLRDIYEKHLNNTEKSILTEIDSDWKLVPIVQKISSLLDRDVFDPRSRIHIKKNLISSKENSVSFFRGVAFSGKIFSHRNCLAKSNLKVLLLSFPLEFRHEQNRLQSMDDLLLQEQEWLSHCCARIINRNPDVIVTSKSISFFAKALLLKTESIILITNVKESAINRISKTTQSEIVSNIEQLKNNKIGQINKVKTEIKIGDEAMILMESTTTPFYSIILHGNSLEEMEFIQKTRKSSSDERSSDCNCEELTKSFTERFRSSSSGNNNEIPFEEIVPDFALSPIPAYYKKNLPENIKPFIRLDMKTSYSLFQSNSHKKHRFHVPEPLEIEPHEFTAPNKVYNQEDSQRILAHFRACGSYPKPNPNKVEKGFESGIMIGSTYNQFEKIHEYSLVYSSYCLERDDHLLCSNPSIVQLIPYSLQDLSVRQFISQLSQSDLCAHCSLPNRLHVRRMVHSNRVVHVIFSSIKLKVPNDSILFWVENGTPIKLDSSISSMSIACFLKLLLSPSNLSISKSITYPIRENHYFAVDGMLCTIKPFEMKIYGIRLPEIGIKRKKIGWNPEPYGADLNILSKEGYSLLDDIKNHLEAIVEQIDSAKGHIGDLETYHKTQRDSFRQEMDEALMKYSKVFQKYTQTNEVTWEDICETIYDVGNLGLKITQLSEAWQLLITKLMKEQEIEYDLQAEAELPEILSSSINYLQSVINQRQLSNKRHFLPPNAETVHQYLGHIQFPIREDEPTSLYAYALLHPTLLEKSDESYVLNCSSQDTQFQCKIYHHLKFEQLRKCFLENEIDFIESMIRCDTWAAKGGKSGASFYKSHDHRFVIKNISQKEVKTIIDYGAEYVSYMTESIATKKPSCLAKIFGAFNIHIKSNSTKKEIQLSFIIMEDIFFGKDVSKTYDLKGSKRNRMSKEDNIFLDMNYINHMRDNPVYIDKASHSVLNVAVNNDAKFLSSLSIIDYSLLVGIDAANGELIVGIIDFIRTFTLDKKLEYEFKTHFTPGNTPPTILAPLKYKERFTDSILNYFNYSPDHCDQNLKLIN